MLRRSVADQMGYHDPRLLQIQDLDYWIRLCLQHDVQSDPRATYPFAFTNDKNTSGMSADTQTRAAWEFHKVLRHYLRADDRGFLREIFP